MSSYSTRMISISDSEEPICPRAPPSSARTTRRRRYTERSSSGGDCRCATGKTSFIGEPPKVRAQALHPFACPIKLTALCRFPIRAGSGMDSIGPSLRQEFVQQDHAPAQRKQRIQQPQPSSEARIAAIDVQHCPGEMPLQRLGQRHAGVEQEIRDELHRIVPAEIVEIDEDEIAVRPPQRVVESEIGRA